MRITVIVCLVAWGCSDRTPPPSEAPRPFFKEAPDGPPAHKAPPTLVEIMVTIPGGPFVGRNPCPNPEYHYDAFYRDERPNEPLRVAGFSIDREVVTCPQYAECVAATACPPLGPMECSSGNKWASVGSNSALAYCRWRGARLPSYREWQRAIRGVEGDVYPTGKTLDHARICERPTRPNDDKLRRCEHSSAAGVVYAVENSNYGEWTNEVGCTVDVKGTKIEVAITPKLLSKRLDQFTFDPMDSEIRCARDSPATAPAAAR